MRGHWVGRTGGNKFSWLGVEDMSTGGLETKVEKKNCDESGKGLCFKVQLL